MCVCERERERERERESLSSSSTSSCYGMSSCFSDSRYYGAKDTFVEVRDVILVVSNSHAAGLGGVHSGMQITLCASHSSHYSETACSIAAKCPGMAVTVPEF